MTPPNFNDPRVIKRLHKAFGFTIAFLSSGGRPLSKKVIDSALGHSGNPVSKWLRSTLLICTHEFYNKDTGKSKEWAYNAQGILLLAEILGYPKFEYNPKLNTSYYKQLEMFYKSYSIEYLQDRFSDQLTTGEFRYTQSSNRYWNPLQNCRREIRNELMANNGFKYQYDIESCAPTLLYQLYERNNNFVGELVKLDHIQQLLDNRTAVRNQVAAQTGVEVEDVKVVITALFCGARLISNQYASLYHTLNYNQAQMQALKENPWIQGLRQDIRNMWTGILHGMPEVRTLDNSGKWQIYFELEKLVMDEMNRFMQANQANTFRVHDCLISNGVVSTDDISNQIFTNTGYKTKIELKRY